MSSTFRKIVVEQYGGPAVMQVVEVPLMSPGIGEARVRVRAAGVAWGDVQKRAGLIGAPRPPFTPGYDVAGIVDALGEGVDTAWLNRPVAALLGQGGYSEYVNVDASRLVSLPEGIDPAAAVCLVLNYSMAHQLLHRAARARSGDRLLVHGAAGGVGTALLQLGRVAGLELLGTASTHKLHVLRDLGAAAIDNQREDFIRVTRRLAPPGVDIVADPVGGAHLWRSLRALRPGGRLLCFGVQSLRKRGTLGLLPHLARSVLIRATHFRKHLSLVNLILPRAGERDWFREDLFHLFGLFLSGKIAPIIAGRVRLEDARRAHALLEERCAAGKVVLVID